MLRKSKKFLSFHHLERLLPVRKWRIFRIYLFLKLPIYPYYNIAE